MKVLQINSVCGIRSTGRICTDLADALTKNGNECKIAYGRETVPEKYQKYAVRIGSEFDVKMHVLRSRLFDNTGFGSEKVTKRFIEWVKTYDPDLIHLHNIHGYYINVELLFQYLKTCGKPIIWTLHDCWSFTGHCAYFDFAKCDKWEKGCSSCSQKKEYPKSVIFDHSKKNYEIKKNLFTGIDRFYIITPSNWLAMLVSRSFLKNYPTKIIHNGVDTSIFQPTDSAFRKKYNLENKKIILGVASIWDRRKGLKDFLKLSELLNDNAKIVIVGLTEKQKESMPSNIICIKQTNSAKELAEIYTAADVFFNPTYEDNYPTVNLEAISCNTPVITYNSGGSPESASLYGRIVPKGNLECVKDEISRIDDLPFSATAMIDGKTSVNIYQKAYSSILNRGN